ncbi:MAG: PQQ-like beta-propeller repeat protein [Thermotogae bacterium]|nr:PQQ-like beta-propeller repeat protein [Thermotogota bacterium]
MIALLIQSVAFGFAIETWTMFNGSSNNASVQVLRGNYSSGWVIEWETSFISSSSSENYGQFAIEDVDGDGSAEVIAPYSSYLRVMDGLTGTIEWQYTRTRTGWLAAPLVVDLDGDGNLEIVTDDGGTTAPHLVALRGNDGTVLWSSITLNGGMYSSPKGYDINDDGVVEVAIGTDGGRLYVFRGTTGDTICSFTASDTIRSIAAMYRNFVVFGSHDFNVYALDSTCNLLWSYTTGGKVWSSPVLIKVNSDTVLDVVVGSYDGHVYALDGRDGSLIWSYDLGCAVRSAPAVADIDADGYKNVIAASTCGDVVNLRITDGTLLWNTTLSRGAWPYGAIAIADLDTFPGLEIIVLTEPSSWSYNASYLLSSSGDILHTFSGYGDGIAIGDVDGDGCSEVFLECDGCSSGKDALFDSPSNDATCGILSENDQLELSEFPYSPTLPDGIYTPDGRHVFESDLKPGLYFVIEKGRVRKLLIR